MAKKGDKFEEIVEPEKLHEDKIIKTIKIQQVKSEGKQSFYVRIPMEVVDALNIKKGDNFIFEVKLENNPKNNKGYFKLGGNNGKKD